MRSGGCENIANDFVMCVMSVGLTYLGLESEMRRGTDVKTRPMRMQCDGHETWTCDTNATSD